MSQRANALIGFAVAGAAVIALAGPAPKIATGLVAIIGLGVVLSHAGEVQAMANIFTSSLKPIG